MFDHINAVQFMFTVAVQTVVVGYWIGNANSTLRRLATDFERLTKKLEDILDRIATVEKVQIQLQNNVKEDEKRDLRISKLEEFCFPLPRKKNKK